MAGIFKAYDVRGIVPDRDRRGDRRARSASRSRSCSTRRTAAHGKTVVVEPRHAVASSVPLERALIEGLLDAGLDVVDIGLATTPMNYFAVGHLGAAGGVQVTASHNPAQYNGFKFSRHDARPVSGDHGIPELERSVGRRRPARGAPARRAERARPTSSTAYREHVLSLPAPGAGGREAAQGGGRRRQRHGHASTSRSSRRPASTSIPLYFELDGTFPNHEAEPAQGREPGRPVPARARDRRRSRRLLRRRRRPRRVRRRDAASRSAATSTTALIAGELLEREPGKAVVYDLRSSRAVPEYIKEHGGIPVRERVGHSFIKATLREHARHLRRRAGRATTTSATTTTPTARCWRCSRS